MESSSFLPQEIIIHILSLLPAKTIGRCRCVSKPWRALLSQPHFIKTHLDLIRNTKLQQRQQQSLILLSESGCLFSVPFNFGSAHHLFDEITERVRKLSFACHPDSWAKVLAFCDGLVLVEDNQDKIFLVNPVTREIRQVPRSPFALAPRASFTMYGLGYDSVNGDYKIVTLSYYYPHNEYEPDCTEMFVNVYSVKNGTWKKAESSPYDHAVAHATSGLFVNGYIHWLALETKSYSSVITAFDLVQEKFYEVPPPNSIGEFVFNLLVELAGCLCMFRSSYWDGTDVWIMKEYGNKESWTKFTITEPKGSESRPLCLLGREQVVLVNGVEEDYAKFVKYDLDKDTLKDIVVHGNSDDFEVEGAFVKSFVPFNGPRFRRGISIESLVSPHCSHETS